MATNQVLPEFKQVSLPVPTGTSSNDPLVVWGIPVVANEDEGNVTTGYATCITVGSWDLSVEAVDDSGNTVISAGDIIYYDANNTPVLSRKTSGVKFGKAAAAVAVGATATIEVILGQFEESGVGITGRGTYCEFETNPVSAGIGGGAATGTAGDENVLAVDGVNFEYHISGTQTILAPSLAADGLNVGMDQTEDDGVELTRGITSRNPESFVVGTDPAFFFKCRFTIPNVSGTDDCLVGFRKVEAYAAYDAYNDAAGFNVVSGDVYLSSIIGGAATVETDTTNNWADAAEHELEILVSAAGVVTYKIDSVAPVVTAAYTFTSGLRIMPFFYFLHAAAPVAGAITISKWESGFQA